MPVALVLRLLLRVAASLLFWRFATARRGAYGTGAQPGRRPAAPNIDRRRSLAGARENAGIAARVVALLLLLIVTAVGIAAGLGPAILGPRWLGIALLIVASGALGFAVLETLSVQRAFAARNRRRHDSELSKQVYS